jgi:hypothetical protein
MRQAMGGRARDVLPPRRTRPPLTGTRPATALTSVDLPAPFGPSTATISPGLASSDALRIIGTPGS